MADAKGPLVGGIIVSCLGLAGLGVSAWGLTEIAADSDWVELQARVLDAKAVPFTFEGQRAGGGTYEAEGTRVQVRYSYDVGGKSYESSRYSRDEPWDDFKGSSHQADAAARMRSLKSGRVKAWYDPADPASAVLARANRAAPYAVGGVGLILLAIGMLQLLRARALSRGDDDEWEP